MKFVFILGDAAVGKMTVGQELMKITDLRLFHNHMTIEPVIEIFGRFDGKTISELRDVIFKNFAASQNYGMIFTLMLDFDMPSEWEYLAHIREIFEPYGTEFYYVELIAPQEIRLQRNASENRLKNKASKRKVESSNQRLLEDDELLPAVHQHHGAGHAAAAVVVGPGLCVADEGFLPQIPLQDCLVGKIDHGQDLLCVLLRI